MKKKVILASCLAGFSAINASHAIDLKQSKITQVVNDVQIISATDQKEKAASVNDVFNMPDLLRTGPASRAELVAEDETVTRVGANTIFSFDPASRTIDLKQGSLLFHSPHGKGGGTIHTGSATASVLGTTLIVTTTPSGGLKVLDLEGKVEVNFLKGLKQTLAPGQMTFVLPGGNHLAPIIVYRLDDLTKNSLLVKGFHHQLASLPLIENQIQKQLKQIKSGHYTDTGLLVGDDASSSQVQVLDPNTLQTALNPSGAKTSDVNSAAANRALGADATINQSSLTDASLPTPPKHVFTDEQFNLPNNTFFPDKLFTGFAARNVFFNTQPAPTPETARDLQSSPLSVDMSPYAGFKEFDLVAANNMEFDGSVNFDGFSSQNSIFFYLAAGNQILIAPGANINANVANLEMAAAGDFTLDNSAIGNNVGNIAMNFGSTVTMEDNSSINAFGDLTIKSKGDFSLNSSSLGANTLALNSVGGTLTLDSSTLICNLHALLKSAGDLNFNNSVINSDSESGSVTFQSTGGSVNLNNSTVQTHFLTINSGDGILLSGEGQSYFATGSGGQAQFTAPNIITVSDANFGGFASVNMSANTINLYNVSFADGSVDNMGTHTGLATVNQGGNTPGELNLHNVNYGGTAITSTSQINFTSGASTQAGINSFANGR